MKDELLNKIISVAYNDASYWEKFKIRRLSKNNKEVYSLLMKYELIANKIHNLEPEKCPSNIVKKSKLLTHTNEQKNSIFYDLYSFVFRRPTVSLGILTVFFLAIVSSLVIKRPEIQKHYSKNDIEIADYQVKQTLTMIYGVFQKTTTTVEKDVFNNRVRKPIKQSFNLVNDYLEGDKNEKIN